MFAEALFPSILAPSAALFHGRLLLGVNATRSRYVKAMVECQCNRKKGDNHSFNALLRFASWVERSLDMSRRAGFLAAVVAATIIAHTGTLSGAGGAISGAVKITGLASNADVVVYIQEAPGTFPPTTRVEMDQRGYQFIPHVLPVVAGTTVRFLNGDPASHNVFSPDYETYNLGTWPQGQTKDYAFAKCAKPPCVYAQLCRVHPQMDAYIVVLQNAYFAVTDKEGHYEIGNVPRGSYKLAVWHARRYKAQPIPVTVGASEPATVDFVLDR